MFIPCITNTSYSTENHLRFPFEIDRKLKPSLVTSLATRKKYKQKNCEVGAVRPSRGESRERDRTMRPRTNCVTDY